MFKQIVNTFLLLLVHAYTISSVAENIGQLPYCVESSGQGILLVSTLDGILSALNGSGSVLWQRNTDPGPLLKSNIHNIELTSNGEWMRLIPSLTGGLYKFNGKTIDAIPISADNLLKSSFFYSHDLVIAGGKEVRTYGVGLHSGNLIYTCSLLGCQNETSFEGEIDNVLIIERNTLTVRAHEPRTGNERWNFSVGHHNIKIPSISCLHTDNTVINFNVTAVLPEGLLIATKLGATNEILWKYKFDAPIVSVWRWDGSHLTVVDVFDIPAEENVKSDLSPAIYLAMHNKQLYIHESNKMLSLIQATLYPNSEIMETKSVTKIPWKPIPASSAATIKSNDHEIAARSVLYNSEFVNGNGYYLYVEDELDGKESLMCAENATNNSRKDATYAIMGSLHSNWAYTVLFLIAAVTVYLMFGPRTILVSIEKSNSSSSTDLPRTISTNSEETDEKEKFVSNYESTFETIGCLGKGGFGVVFEAKQKIDECSYAIKRIALPRGRSQDHVLREVKALAKLEHRNIVRYYNSWFERPPIGWRYNCEKKIHCDPFEDDGAESVSTKPKHKRNNSTIIDMSIISHDNDMSDSDIVFKDSTYSGGVSSESNSVLFHKFTCPNEETRSNSVVFKDDFSVINASDSTPESSADEVEVEEASRNHRASPRCEGPTYLYIQMQLCKRESLRDWLFSNASRNRAMVLPIFRQILNAVEYIHSKGLIHRDLKPNNIFFSMDDDIKVGDFGLVTTMSDKDEDTNASIALLQSRTNDAGTELYMSPEQMQKQGYNLKVDIYSLGVILFELLVPFKTEMERCKTLKALRDHSYPKEFNTNFPDEHRLLEKMLSDNPDVRPTTGDIKKTPPFTPTC